MISVNFPVPGIDYDECSLLIAALHDFGWDSAVDKV